MTTSYPLTSSLKSLFPGFLPLALGLLLLPGLAPGQTAPSKPITKSGLTHALQIGGLSQKELADQVARRGVDFTVTSETETDLRHAGADSALIEAVREHYRNPDSALAALDAPDTPAPASSAHVESKAGSGTPRQRVTTLRDVRKVYIDKMPNGLDGYLRASISHKLGSFFTIVLDRPEADAILQTTDSRAPGAVSLVDPTGKYVFWSGSATDKEKVYLNFRHRGQRELAEKLAAQLKKALQ